MRACGGGERSLFPLPRVFIDERDWGGRTGSPRLQDRRKRVQRLCLRVNAAAATLSALSVGSLGSGQRIEARLTECVGSGGVRLRGGGMRVREGTTALQCRFLCSLVTRVADAEKRGCSGSSPQRDQFFWAGLAEGSKEGVDDGRCDAMSSGRFGVEYSSARSGVALVASRVALPGRGQGGTVGFFEYLPLAWQEFYGDSSNLVKEEGEGERFKGGGKGFAEKRKEEYHALLRRMREANMVKFVEEGVFEGLKGVTNGVFCVRKSVDQDRIIIDLRHGNSHLKDPPKVELPTPDMWTRLVLPPGEKLLVGKSDLGHCYHSISTENVSYLWRLFGLPACDGRAMGFGAGRFVPVPTTVPMGWKHAVHMAQTAHLNFILTRTLFKEEDRVCAENDFRLDRVRWFVYLDDLVVLAPASMRKEAQVMFDSYLTAVANSGWVLKPSKVVLLTTEPVEVLGFLVDGETGLVSPSPAKLFTLLQRTESVLFDSRVSGVELRRLLGSWSWFLLLKRPLFSVFSGIYGAVEGLMKMGRGNVRAQLWQSARRELNAVVSLAPLLSASLRASWAPTAYCSDASTAGLGVVSAPLRETEGLWKSHGKQPGQLGSAVRGWLFQRGEVVMGWDWTVRASARWRGPVGLAHINVLEFRALLLSVRRAVSGADWCKASQLLASWTDSSVVLGAACKGRSSSWLNRHCRELAALLVLSDTRLVLSYISTLLNPADEPSRVFPA
jgi:hypothetical protein